MQSISKGETERDEVASIRLWTARILRDNPHLRTKEATRYVIEAVREKRPDAQESSVIRYINDFQNRLGMYKPFGGMYNVN